MDRTFDLLTLKRRMGWTSSDLARRLNIDCREIEILEKGEAPKNQDLLTRIEFLFRQADLCCEEVKRSPRAESLMDDAELEQVADGNLLEKDSTR